MITEDYVSFETAKLLKEKGFDEPCHALYHDGDDKIFFGLDVDSYRNAILNADCYACPTLQMALKWLREVYRLAIHVELIDFLEHGEVWFYGITDIKTVKRLNIKDEDFTEHSYEQACEAAIKYCLKNLI